MSCAITVGRVQAFVTGEFCANAWDFKGEHATLRATIYVPGILNAEVLRAQVIGHVENNDVVPVTWEADESIGGYYRILDATVAMHGSSLLHGIFDVVIEMERVVAWASPLWESLAIGATLTNGLGLTGSPWHAVPGSPTIDTPYVASTSATYTRTTPDGLISLFFWPTFFEVPRWRVITSKFYVGAATIERLNATDGTYRAVTGLQIENRPTSWRLQNGLVRVLWIGNTLSVSHFDGTTWETAKLYTLSADGAFTVLTPTHVTIIRNDPEQVVLRLINSQNNAGSFNIDLSLRRGDRFVRLYLQNRTAETWRISRSPNEAGTSITGGLRATSNDASGNRYVMASATATVKNTTDGQLALPAPSTRFEVGIGSEIGGSAAVAPDSTAGSFDLFEQYFAAQDERTYLAGR